jgi:hypothetical protein
MRVNIRTQLCLSRRDQMMVAWHEMPGTCHPEARPVGYGLIDWREWLSSPMMDKSWRHSSHRSLRDGSCLPFTRHFMPGYHRSVPSGRRPTGSPGPSFSSSSSSSNRAARSDGVRDAYVTAAIDAYSPGKTLDRNSPSANLVRISSPASTSPLRCKICPLVFRVIE